MPHEIRVHIDTLKYTREGLATKEPIDLRVGEHNQVVLVRPERRKALALGSGSFAVGSVFPTPGVLSVSMIAAAQNKVNVLLGLNPSSIFQVYGHADTSGDEVGNKTLTDKRAQAVKAVLTADVDAFAQLADEEGWGLREHQVMLRSLKCDPGAIDGEPGDMTTAAVELFQHEYMGGVFHRHQAGREPAETLDVDGRLEGTTVAALLESYVLSTSAHLTEEQIHPTHAAVGCSEFNLADLDNKSSNRRVSLVVHPTLPPHHDAAPCIEGDSEVCPIDGRHPRVGCLWYREHVIDPGPAELVHRHFDLRWLLLPNDRVLLSALTTLADGDEIVFQVFRTKPLGSSDLISEAVLGEPISDEISGLIRGSVAQLAWDDPIAPSLLEPTVEPIEEGIDLHALLSLENRVRLPVFTVRGGGVRVISGPPGRELERLPPEFHTEEAHRTGFAGVDWFGRVYQHGSTSEPRPSASAHPLQAEHAPLWAHRHMHRALSKDGS